MEASMQQWCPQRRRQSGSGQPLDGKFPGEVPRRLANRSSGRLPPVRLRLRQPPSAIASGAGHSRRNVRHYSRATAAAERRPGGWAAAAVDLTPDELGACSCAHPNRSGRAPGPRRWTWHVWHPCRDAAVCAGGVDAGRLSQRRRGDAFPTNAAARGTRSRTPPGPSTAAIASACGSSSRRAIGWLLCGDCFWTRWRGR